MPERRKDERWIEEKTPLSYLGDRVYLGSVENAKDEPELREKNITHAVHMCVDVHPEVLADAAWLKDVLRIEIKDAEDAQLSEHLDRINTFISSALAANPENRVLVFCRVGQSRSATACIAYYMYAHKTSLLEAFSHIRAIRPIIYPNGGFRSQLLERDCFPNEEEKMRVDREIIIQCLQGLGLMFPQTAAEFTREEIETCLNLCENEVQAETIVRNTLIREMSRKASRASRSSTSSLESTPSNSPIE